jgi:hypothetical protein
MKKIILSVCTLLVIAASASAQSVHLGIKAGANFDKLQGQSFKDGFNAGWQGGAWLDIGLNKYIGIEPEVLFNQTNTKYAAGTSDAIPTLTDGSNIKLNYLTIPVLLNIKAASLLTLQLGPQYGILMNSHETLLENGKDAFKSGNFALVLGARLNLGSVKVFGRYNIGLSDINDATNSDKWKSQQIQLGIGFTIL